MLVASQRSFRPTRSLFFLTWLQTNALTAALSRSASASPPMRHGLVSRDAVRPAARLRFEVHSGACALCISLSNSKNAIVCGAETIFVIC